MVSDLLARLVSSRCYYLMHCRISSADWNLQKAKIRIINEWSKIARESFTSIHLNSENFSSFSLSLLSSGTECKCVMSLAIQYPHVSCPKLLNGFRLNLMSESCIIRVSCKCNLFHVGPLQPLLYTHLNRNYWFHKNRFMVQIMARYITQSWLNYKSYVESIPI